MLRFVDSPTQVIWIIWDIELLDEVSGLVMWWHSGARVVDQRNRSSQHMIQTQTKLNL